MTPSSQEGPVPRRAGAAGAWYRERPEKRSRVADASDIWTTGSFRVADP